MVEQNLREILNITKTNDENICGAEICEQGNETTSLPVLDADK